VTPSPRDWTPAQAAEHLWESAGKLRDKDTSSHTYTARIIGAEIAAALFAIAAALETQQGGSMRETTTPEPDEPFTS